MSKNRKHHGNYYNNNQERNSLKLNFNGLRLDVDIDKFGGYIGKKVKQRSKNMLDPSNLLEDVIDTNNLIPTHIYDEYEENEDDDYE